MGVIPADVAQQLLGSIEADRLVIFAGAGLSMAPPSTVPSALRLARHTAEKYAETTLSSVPDGANENLEAQAEFFFANGLLVHLFINRLVDWEPFRRSPNRGHAAVADFLCVGPSIAPLPQMWTS